MKIKNENGEEIEVLTPAEVEAKLSEATKAIEDKYKEVENNYNSKLTSIQGDLEKLSAEKKELEDKINGTTGGEDHPNFKILKEALDKKSNQIDELTKSIDEVNRQRVGDYLDTEIKKVAGKDEEVAKKIKFHFDTTLQSMPHKTKDEIIAKVEAAAKLADVNSGPSALDNLNNGGYFPTGGSNPGQVVELTTREKELGKKFGVTEEDIKKYSPKLKKTYDGK